MFDKNLLNISTRNYKIAGERKCKMFRPADRKSKMKKLILSARYFLKVINIFDGRTDFTYKACKRQTERDKLDKKFTFDN